MHWVWFHYEKPVWPNRTHDCAAWGDQSTILHILSKMFSTWRWLSWAHEHFPRSISLECRCKQPTGLRHHTKRTRFWRYTENPWGYVGSRDVDLSHVMQLKRREIENIINISVQQHSPKVRFNSVIDLVKPMKTDDDLSSSRPDRSSIHVAWKTERVDFVGLADKNFHAMVEQMLQALNNFASHGSGWNFNQIINIEIR